MTARGEAWGSRGDEETECLVIDDAVRLDAARVIDYARRNWVPMSRLMGWLVDGGDYVAPGHDPNRVLNIPSGCRCVYTEEAQPSGLCRHLSLSVGQPGMLPSDEAVEEVMRLFGFKSASAKDALAFYLEDTDTPGIQAINVIEIMV